MISKMEAHNIASSSSAVEHIANALDDLIRDIANKGQYACTMTYLNKSEAEMAQQVLLANGYSAKFCFMPNRYLVDISWA